ncbi:unnamed protein product [Withania somnifera]
MYSTVFYTSVHPSTLVFSRKQLPLLISKDFPAELYHSLPCRSLENGHIKKIKGVKATLAEAPVTPTEKSDSGVNGDLKVPPKKLKVLVAGGGIGGLVFALAANKKGFDVLVFERDLSAIRGEGQYRGPIQIQSNALAALEAIDMDVAEEIMNAGCITGQRINGLVDGISGNWYCKFDTFTPAVEGGLPVTRVSGMTLQQILARGVGVDILLNESNVVNFEDDGEKVTVVLENGQRYTGDLLVGADGIRSKVRTNLFGHSEATYSGYTCYTGIADFVPADIETVGNGKRERLLKIFGGWCNNVLDLLVATDEDAILRRDIYDRPPTFNWGRGRVTLLGDSVHAMQPNLGQGGCMAIEDSYQLAMELDKAWSQSVKSGSPVDIISSLRSYESARKVRVGVIHGLARMAAIMASTYKAYLGVGLGPLSFLTKYRIPHPGRVGGRIFIDLGMPLMLSWVLGGNGDKLEGRIQHCRLSERANDQLRKWFEDDDALERASDAEWLLLPSGNANTALETIVLSRDENVPCTIGSVSHTNIPGKSVVVPFCQTEPFFLTDLQSEHDTWVTDNEGRKWRVSPNFPTRFHSSDVIEFGSDKAAFRVKAMKIPPITAERKEEREVVGAA